MFKNYLIILAMVFLFGISSLTFAAGKLFSDVPTDHWNYDSVMMLASEGIVQPYSDGTFRGRNNATRYEIAVVLANVLNKNGNTIKSFVQTYNDVPKTHAAYSSVAMLVANDIVTPSGDGNFYGDRYITRYELAMMMANVFAKGAAPTGRNMFSDLTQGHEAYDAVLVVTQKGIMDGYADGTFRGDRNISRYEVAGLLARALAKQQRFS